MSANIVVFMLDQLSAKWVEAAERNDICPVPNLRALKADGVTFANAISSNPVCCPARATLATGLTSRGHGVIQNGYELDPELPTFMRLLQSNGYRTGAFGKVHLHPHYKSLHPDYSRYGFDVTHITEDPRGGEWLDWVRENHPEHFEAALATIWAPGIPELESYGPGGENLAERIRAIRAEFDWSQPEFPGGNAWHYALPFPEEVGQTAWITSRALDFIASTPADTPFLAHVSYVQPHAPFNAPGRCFDVVQTDAIPDPVRPEWSTDPHSPTAFHDGSHRFRPEVDPSWTGKRHAYFADLAHLDEQLGVIMDALERANRRDNTYIVLLADHGDMLGDHGCTGKGEMHYDACVRVPLIVAGPGLASGSARNELVQLEDIFPTIAEMGGVDVPALPSMGDRLKEAPRPVAGRSLMPLARGECDDSWRTAAYAESYNNIVESSTTHWARTVRTERYRYTYYPGTPDSDTGEGSGEQLFDLQTDPDETRNLVGDAAHATTRERLRAMLLEAIIKQDYPHPRRGLYALGVH